MLQQTEKFKKLLEIWGDLHVEDGDVVLGDKIVEINDGSELIKLAEDQLEENEPITALETLNYCSQNYLSSLDEETTAELHKKYARSYLELDRDEKGAKKLLKATEFLEENIENSLLKAKGFLLLEDFEEAKEKSEEVLQENPYNPDAYQIYVQSLKDKELPEIISDIPEELEDEPPVVHAISFLYTKKEDFESAKDWSEKLIEDDGIKDNPSFESKYQHAKNLFHLVSSDESAHTLKQFTLEQREILKKAISLFEELKQELKNTELLSKRLYLHYFLAKGYELLGNSEEALSNINKALQLVDEVNWLELDRQELIDSKISILLGSNELEEVLSFIEGLEQSLFTKRVEFLYVTVLEKIGKIQELSEYFEDKETFDENNEFERQIMRLRLDYLLSIDDDVEAKNWVQELKEIFGEDIYFRLSNSKLQNYLGESDRAIQSIEKAVELREEAGIKRNMVLAETCFDYEMYEEAAEIYDDLIRRIDDSYLSRKLIKSTFEAKTPNDVLDLTAEFEDRPGLSKFITDLNSFIYEKIEDYEKAKEECQKYLNDEPGDFEIKLKKAMINARLDNNDEVSEFLDEIGTSNVPDDLQADLFCNLIQLAALTDRFNQAIKLSYRRLIEEKEPKIIGQYINLFFPPRNEVSRSEMLDADEVQSGTAVTTKNEVGDEIIYLVDVEKLDRGHPVHQDSFKSKLIGSKEGEIIIDDANNRELEILEIRSKFIYAFHECLEISKNSHHPDLEFPKVPMPIEIDFDETDEDTGLPVGMDKIFKTTKEGKEWVQQSLELYRDRKITLA